MDNKRIKEAIDRKISKDPLFTDADRRRFYESRSQPKRQWTPMFPKVMTALLVFLLISGSIYFVKSGNPFKNPADAPEEQIEERLPAPEDHAPSDVEEVVEEIKDIITDPARINDEESLKQLGEDVTQNYSSNGSIDSRGQSRKYIFLKGDNFNYSSTLPREGPPSIEHFQREELGVFLKIDNEDTNTTVSITYLSKDKEHLIEESSGNISEGFEKVVDANKPLEMQELVRESIAQSLDKEPDSLTKGDLLEVEELTIDASHLNGIYDWQSDPEVFSSLRSLRKLKLNQVKVSGELLKEIPHLEQMTFIGPTLDDLSSVAEGLQQVQYLNIKNSSFRGNADDILKLKSLNIVTLDKSVVTDYEKLQFESIDVRW
ncbi:hypothetical protein [Halobacillus sp. BBL2006]|uniref:hypothetical protein n=1 Tax=Halobacillus sp. BBL2006 TaxID=1543706 RepID=UPI000541A228|nr:hypothetical protein [Halobacillus sp. BBL2006]KHE68413.1 hypothetical protein LD39_14685 [Halobacillus sp. BBL2006]